MSPTLSVLVVTYDCEGFVAACLDAVTTTTRRHPVELVVADNASSDGGVAAVRRSHPEAVVVEMGANTGFACAVNAAAAASSGEVLLLLNPDTVVLPGALDTLVDVARTVPGAGAVAPRLLNTDGSDQGTARSFPTPAAAVAGRRSPLTRIAPRNRWSRRYLVGRDHTGEDPFAVDWVSGACLLTPRRVFEDLGGLDEGFFMHFEDADYCHRVARSGRRVLCAPRARVVHHEGGSRRGWPPAQVAHFHYGAYRYWSRNHAAGTPLAVLRPVAAAALTGRALAVMTANELHGPARGAKR